MRANKKLLMERENTFPNLSLKTLAYVAIGISSIVYYTQIGSHLIGEYYFGRAASTYFHVAVLTLLSVLTLTAVGCSVHLRAIGGFRRGELLGELNNGLQELRAVSALGEGAIAEVESILPRHAAGLTADGAEAMRILRQILKAIDARRNAVEQLKSLGRTPELCEAVVILRKKLRAVESAQTALIDIDPFPAIPNEKLLKVVSELVSELKSGLRLAA